MALTPEQKMEVMRCLDAGKPLPDKYRFLLFGETRQVELLWNGKTGAVCDVALPFQTIEQVDEPRAESAAGLDIGGRQQKGWTNKLIWGDNKLILSSLSRGSLRRAIEDAGGLKLIYIDPPFDVGADFSMNIEIGGDSLTKEPGVLEMHAYRDTWGKGADSFIAMIYERLRLMRELLADDGSIYVHCDWRVNSYIRLVLNDVFGKDNFVREVIWSFDTKSGYKSAVDNWVRSHDTILYCAKNTTSKIFNKQYEEYGEEYLQRFKKKDADGRWYRDDRGNDSKQYLDELKGIAVPDVWRDIKSFQQAATSAEYLSYPTQKPEALLERIIKAASNSRIHRTKQGEVSVADFFFIARSVICQLHSAQLAPWLLSPTQTRAQMDSIRPPILRQIRRLRTSKLSCAVGFAVLFHLALHAYHAFAGSLFNLGKFG